MERVRTTGTTDIPAGVTLELSAEQAAARVKSLKAAGKNRYVTTTFVQFKKGEVFGVEGLNDKGRATTLEPVTPAKGEKTGGLLPE